MTGAFAHGMRSWVSRSRIRFYENGGTTSVGILFQTANGGCYSYIGRVTSFHQEVQCTTVT